MTSYSNQFNLYVTINFSCFFFCLNKINALLTILGMIKTHSCFIFVFTLCKNYKPKLHKWKKGKYKETKFLR